LNWKSWPWQDKVLLLERLRKQTSQIISEQTPRRSNIRDFSEYIKDPVGFGEKVLGDVYTDEVKAMMRSVCENDVTIAISANATGKSFAAGRIAWWYKAVHGNDCQVYAVASPERNLRDILWAQISNIAEMRPDVTMGHKKVDLKYESAPLAFIEGLTVPTTGTVENREGRFSGKHAPFLMFIVDEGDTIPDEVYKGIESCMSGGTEVRLLIMFNPRYQSGEVYRMIRDGRGHVVTLSAFNHPNVMTGENVIPGAVTRATTIRRINQWCRPLMPNEEGTATFTLPKFLEGQTTKAPDGTMYPPLKPGRYEIQNPAFSYMVLGQYPAQASNQLISTEWIYAARTRYDAYVAKHGEIPPAGIRPIQGLDVAEFGDDYNVACFRYGGWVAPFVLWHGVDTITSGEKAAMEYKARNAYKANVDGTGLGAGVAPYMVKLGCTAFSIKVASKPTFKTEMGEFGILNDQLAWSVREWLRTDPSAMLPPDEMLIEELQTPTYKNDKGKIRIMDKDTMKEILKRSPDRLDALKLTFAPSETVLDPLDLSACAV